jgi:ubiquinone/menaquinone biosynthesis C-methylase UbiE
MTQQPIRFDDGAAYDRGMGVWSQIGGQVFLDWLAPSSGLRWIDIGCGSGAFTELLAQRCAPAEIQGIDPSEAQFAFARTRPALRETTFLRGDAMALPFEADRFDAAVMALVLFFVPDPAKGVAEMARVVCPGGTVSTYLWIAGEGPPAPFTVELAAFGATVARAPSADAACMEVLRGCGGMRAWRRLRAAKSRCAEPSPISMTYGPQAWAFLRSRTPSPR